MSQVVVEFDPGCELANPREGAVSISAHAVAEQSVDEDVVMVVDVRETEVAPVKKGWFG